MTKGKRVNREERKIDSWTIEKLPHRDTCKVYVGHKKDCIFLIKIGLMALASTTLIMLQSDLGTVLLLVSHYQLFIIQPS